LARRGRRSPYSEADPTRKASESRKTPTASTTSPATRWPVVDRTIGTSTPANAPTDVKTTEKPAMNRSIGRGFGRVREVCVRDRTDPGPSPAVTKDRYPGTRGRTHGEANATIPAANARKGAHHAVRSNSPMGFLVSSDASSSPAIPDMKSGNRGGSARVP
jgi:hypothetical protein